MGKWRWREWGDALRSRLGVIYDLRESPNRIRSLEGSRGLAMSLVFYFHFDALFHSFLAAGSPSSLASDFIATTGRCGADMFLILSGYLIYGQMLRRRISYLSFVKRRVARIYPSYLCVLGIYIALSLLFPARSKLPDGIGAAIVFILENVALLPGVTDIPAILSVSWTLSFLFCFYLTVPLVVNWLGMRGWTARRRSIFFATAAVAYFVVCSVSDAPLRLVMLVVGILAYERLSLDSFKNRLTLAGEKLMMAMFVPLLAAGYALRTPAEAERLCAGLGQFSPTLRIVSIAAMLYGFSIYCFGFDGRLKRWFGCIPLRYLGNMSYSYYLMHGLAVSGAYQVISRIASRAPQGAALFWAALPACYLLAAAASTVLFVSIEKRFSISTPARVEAPAARAQAGVEVAGVLEAGAEGRSEGAPAEVRAR